MSEAEGRAIFRYFREVGDMLKNAKDLEEARKKFRELVLTLVLGE